MPKTKIESPAPTGIAPGLVLLFAFAGGVAVSNLYWAQPLLVTIARSLGVPVSSSGLLVTFTQLGYAIGVLLLVPLGDVLNRRRLISSIMVLSALALAAASFAPGFASLLASLACVGMLTVAGQMLPPLSGDLAAPDQRGRVVGTVVSGMLMGILLSRAVSGVLADLLGWRLVFAIAAGATLVMAFLLWRYVPSDSRRTSVPYVKLLASTFGLLRDHAVVRTTLLMGACTFAVFSLFWTGLTFLLSSAPFNYSLTQIGLVGVAGLAGAIAAKSAGKLHDRGLSAPATGWALALTLVSLLIAGLGAASIFAIIVAVVFLDAAIQSVNVLNQTRLISLDPSARSRMNSAFVACNFIGGAVGSSLAGRLWPLFGWNGLMIAAALLIGLALVVWAIWRPGAAST